MRTVASFASVADRDAILDADMSRGVQDGHDRLEELLAKAAGRVEPRVVEPESLSQPLAPAV